jgi:hypothetical protein
MTQSQLQQYDRFLDENDWDIYYWATQESSPTSEGHTQDSDAMNSPSGAMRQDPLGKAPIETAEWKRPAVKGEWAQTVGAFKPAYRPVPSRWKDSEILALIRKHVQDRSAGVDGKSSDPPSVATGSRAGLGMMPEVKNFDS